MKNTENFLGVALSLIMAILLPTFVSDRPEKTHFTQAVITEVKENGITVEYTDENNTEIALQIPLLVDISTEMPYKQNDIIEIPINEKTNEYDPKNICKIHYLQ